MHIHRRISGDEGRLFLSIVESAGQLLDGNAQGFYVLTRKASGRDVGGPVTLHSFRHTIDPAEVKRMLVEALQTIDLSDVESAATEWHEPPGFTLEAPDGFVVLDVVSKVLGGYDTPTTNFERLQQSFVGHDHCWIRSDEADTLSEGEMPVSLLKRMALYHFVDNTRGEPPVWRLDQLREVTASLGSGRLTGSVRLESEGGQRGYHASLAGFVSARGGKVKQFDVIANGMAWGRGYHNAGAPRGRYPLAIRFTLAEGVAPFDGIPPGAARTGQREYIEAKSR